MTHIDPVCGMQVNEQNGAGRGAPREDLLFLFRECARNGSIRIRSLMCSGRCASRAVNTPNATGLRAGRLCAAPFNPLGAHLERAILRLEIARNLVARHTGGPGFRNA